MTPGSCTRHNLGRSPYGNLTADSAEAAQSPTEGPVESASTNGSMTATVPNYVGTSAPFYAPTPTFVLGVVPAAISIEEQLKQFMKIYKASVKVLELNGGQGV